MLKASESESNIFNQDNEELERFEGLCVNFIAYKREQYQARNQTM